MKAKMIDGYRRGQPDISAPGSQALPNPSITPGELNPAVTQQNNVVGGWGSYAKDKLENRLHDLVCKGVVTLADAQHEIANNWIGAYKALIGSVPNNAPSRY
jgi:hypothetical protein